MDPKYYDEYIGTKMEEINFDRVFELIKEIHNKKGRLEILDFCCGTGIFPRKWLSKLKNIRYLGVDINPDFVKFARKNLHGKNFDFMAKDAVSFKTGKKFDIVLATSSYHHIEDKRKRKFLENISAHMKDDGAFIVYEKIIDSFSGISEAIDKGTQFYLERIKYMMKTEKLNENQIFALFNEQYLTSIRHEEYKVDIARFKGDIKACGLKIKKTIKIWPRTNVFNNKNVGDFVFLIVRK
ncbi:class I SAM-dependent methyltransferase [archaeon]|nr:class I SAM-dependent methyltransferase [archaeon]